MLATLRRRTPLIMTVAALLLAVMASAVFAGDPTGGETLAADPSAPFTFIWLMICGILVFFMQAGFLLVEAGFAKAKNTVNILTKNFMDFSIGGLAFFFFGYGLMYGTDIGGFIGSDGFLLLGDYYDVNQGVGLVLPDGLCGHRGHHRLRGHVRAHPHHGLPGL